ncbi:uncharacterized protein Z520_02368 [Fonsecaea multimorphosa CBS 102226]|uniref:Uncharacterized protein n=1 Tax=Fonsecaea multimorphosa CBS 102226 TaxID=1442371 RepID=A0A0D2KFH4_9EURO|nr:uncharacterized protein Z520_02368 [Fonsecaea multimorphosa CBS 102226]KIY02230.1 hypothetical protein Z520_02368 [Fonsecaea multimorphosa CBS 102226]OAL29421.1 hypothetical protein AYO22_02315 [Fonsecaea multimorphosa]
MAAIPSFAFPDMDASQLDDKMDVASSPFRQPDDIDIDLDSVRDPSVIGSPHDDMVDDPVEPLNTEPDVMEDQLDETLPDDDMNDEQNVSMLTEQPDPDYNMDASIEGAQGDEDEDILYEDEEDIGAVVQDIEVGAEHSAYEDQPQDYEEVEADVVLEEPGDQPGQQDQTDIDTNQDKTLTDDTSPVVTADDAARGQDETQASNAEIPDTSREDGAGQGETDQAPEQAQGEQRDPAADDLEPHPEAEAGNHAFSPDEDGRPAAENQPTTEANEAEPQDQHEETAKNEEDKATPTVHSVTLVYLEEEMSLFPPMLGDASSVYFLPDASLAFEPLDKLLGACREILTGTLDHHDELVLDVPGLGLHICEDSKYAAQITLAQILDVYLQLCNNNAGQAVQPLYCHLSSRVSLASQYAYLCSAGAEGKTYAEIAADHAESPELEGDDAGEASHYEEPQNEGDLLPATEETEAVAASTHDQPSTAHVDDTDTLGQEDHGGEELLFDRATRATVPAASDVDRPEILALPEAPETAEQLELHAKADQDGEPEYLYDETQEPTDNATGQELRPEAQDQPHEDQEHASNSSHTVEADAGDTDFQDIKAADVEAEGLGQSNEEAEDLFQHDEDGPEPESNYEPFGDEELLAAQDELGENIPEDLSATIQDEDPIPTFQGTNETDVSETQPLPYSNANSLDGDSSHLASTVDAQYPGNLSPPMTPVAGKQAKRKAEEDDELILDLDTPDPKRRRPS